MALLQNKVPVRIRIILIPALLFLTSVLDGQQIIEGGSAIDTFALYDNLFAQDDPLHMILTFDIKNFVRTKHREEYQPALLTLHANDSTLVNYDVRVRTRGIFRKKFCSMPPFWLNIKYSYISADCLKGINKLKVVTQCKKAEYFGDYVLKEYLVYRLYNLLTPYSFRVRLVKLTYINTGRKNDISEAWAFLVEPEELLEKRLTGSFVENDRLSMAMMNPGMMDKLAMFEYMIGNGDYSVTGRHNIKIFFNNDHSPYGYIPIPYDFDYTGFVNANYAIPGENLDIESVRERYFLGPCRYEIIHQISIDDFQSYEELFKDLIQTFPHLTLKHKSEALYYIEQYFEEIQSPDFIQRNIKSTCR